MNAKTATELARWIEGLVSEGTYNSVTGEGEALPTSPLRGAAFEVVLPSGKFLVQVTRAK